MLELALILAEHGEGHEGDALLDPHSWGLVFWTAVTFLVVLAVLKKAAWGPILEGLEKRERTIADAIAAAQKDRADAALVLEEHKKKLEAVRNEAQAILNETASDAKHMMDEAHQKAQQEAEATRQRALKDIQLAKQKAVSELREESVELAVTLAEKVLGSEVDRAKQRRLVEDFLEKYERN
ncbi:F0F1 ATP synthase subunit B [bacterium]|nr:F0F1 ATP synthase subunit B [bacterium]